MFPDIMNLLDLGNRPAAWILQQWCDRYLVLPPDASFAVQLSNGTAHLRDVSLKVEPFNHQLRRYGFKLTEGHVSQGELIIQEWSRLKVCIELDTLSLLVQPTTPVEPLARDDSTEGMLSLVPMHALVKWFMMHLKICVRHIIIHFEAGHDCTLQLDLHGVSYERTANDNMPFRIMAQSVECSVTDPSSRESVIHRFLNMEQMSLLLGTNVDDHLHLDLRTGNVRSEIHPDIVSQLPRLLRHIHRRFLDAGGDFDNVLDEAASMVESVFYDAESLSRSGSVHSDITESIFFDCEDHQPNGSVVKRSIVFNCELDRLDVVLHSTFTPHDTVCFSLCLETMGCHGMLGGDSTIEASLGEIRLTDRSPTAEAIVDRQVQCSVPEVLQSLMMSMDEGQTSCIQLGFAQIPRSPCLSMTVHQTAIGWNFSMKSEPVVSWCSCASIERLCRLLHSFHFESVTQERTSLSSLPHFSLDWMMAGVYGTLELPKSCDDHIPGLLLFEMKSEVGTSFLTIKELRESRRWQESIPVQLCKITLSVSELHLHHCPCEAGSILASRCIVSCIAQQEGQLSTLFTGNAATLEITQALGRRPSAHNLSNLAYRLIDAYSQQQEDGFKERTLGRVEYEGKCVHSADSVVELLLGCIDVEVSIDDMEACMDAILNFWHPSKMADQMMTVKEIQTVVILNARRLRAKLKGHQHGSCEEAMYGIEVQGDEIEVVSVGGVQGKTISTLAITVGSATALLNNNHELCRIGSNDDTDGPAIQFFQISELDYRNAKFKQWMALQQRKIRLHGNNDLLSLKWIPTSLKGLVIKNQERIRTDVEVEQCFLMTMHDVWFQYDASTQTSLICAMERSHVNVKNLTKATLEVMSLDFMLEYEGRSLKRWLHEERLEGHFRLENGKKDLEVKNKQACLQLDPKLLTDILTLISNLPKVHQKTEDVSDVDIECQESSKKLHDAMTNDAFSLSRLPRPARDQNTSRLTSHEEDEDGFVMVDDVSNADIMKASQATWLDDPQFQMRDDYINIPQEVPEDDVIFHDQSDDTNWTVRCLDLSLECCLIEEESTDHVIVTANGVNVVYSTFHPGSVYQSRWSGSIQELEVVDQRTSEDGRQILERLRSQLRTACSRRLKQQKTMTFPLVQFSLDTVFPDVIRYASTKEKRCRLTILPLRLRLSHSFTQFCKTYIKAIPSSHGTPSGDCYFQLCTVSAFYVVVDYRPRSVDLERLRSGRTGELINMVEWEGMEFFLNEMKVTGMQGWDSLLGYIVQNWTYDISHAQRHMVAGFPAFGMVRRMSPAAQDVARAAISSIKCNRPIEQDVRGARIMASPSLSRAMTELGRVFSLEVLNLCAHGTEGMHLVFDGASASPAPVNAREGLHKAKDTLRAAARSVITDPIHSARSGEGVGVAMTKALWAVPKALLAPASAATTVLHGTLRSACDALDTDKIFKS